MGVRYLLDSNALIDLMANKLPIKASYVLSNALFEISVISRIEIIGQFAISTRHAKAVSGVLATAYVHHLDEEIVQLTIKHRQQYKIQLADSVIAATAIVNKLTLVTHNLSDFKKIRELKCIDSFLLGNDGQ